MSVHSTAATCLQRAAQLLLCVHQKLCIARGYRCIHQKLCIARGYRHQPSCSHLFCCSTSRLPWPTTRLRPRLRTSWLACVMPCPSWAAVRLWWTVASCQSCHMSPSPLLARSLASPLSSTSSRYNSLYSCFMCLFSQCCNSNDCNDTQSCWVAPLLILCPLTTRHNSVAH